MNANDFYQDYGRHIFRLQQDEACHTLGRWPFVNPDVCGTDIPIDRPEIRRKFKCRGFAYPGYISAVLYEPGYITYMKLPDRHCAAVSYEFSGCYMAKLCFKNEWYVFHLSTASGSEVGSDCKISWMDFLNFHKSHISGIMMIRPSAEESVYENWKRLHFGEGLHVTLAGLIDGRDHGHALVFDFDRCRVAKDEDRNITLAHKVLQARDIDLLDYLKKTI